MARLNRAKPRRELPRRSRPTRQMGHGGRQHHWRPTFAREVFPRRPQDDAVGVKAGQHHWPAAGIEHDHTERRLPGSIGKRRESPRRAHPTRQKRAKRCEPELSTPYCRRPHPKRAGDSAVLVTLFATRSVDAEATTGLAANELLMMVGESGEESPFVADPRRACGLSNVLWLKKRLRSA